MVRNGGGGAPTALIIDVPQALGVHPSRRARPAPRRKIRATACCRASARTGRAPPTSTRGRSSPRGGCGGRAAVAIIIGGLGLNAEGTANRDRQTARRRAFGFAPYGGDLEREVAAARAAGHEILLQAPMELFAYPADNPGPHTLLAGASEKRKISICRTG